MCVFHIPFMNSSRATLVLLKQKAGIALVRTPNLTKKSGGFPVSIKPLMTKRFIIITLTKTYDHKSIWKPMITCKYENLWSHVNMIISGSSVWRRFPLPISRREEKSNRVHRQWSESAAHAKQVDKIKNMMIIMLLLIMMILLITAGFTGSGQGQQLMLNNLT